MEDDGFNGKTTCGFITLFFFRFILDLVRLLSTNSFTDILMLILLFTILFLLIVFYSLGEALSYRLNLTDQVIWSDSIFAGMAISNTFFSLWSLILPCDIVSFIVFILLGIGAFLFLWNK